MGARLTSAASNDNRQRAWQAAPGGREAAGKLVAAPVALT